MEVKVKKKILFDLLKKRMNEGQSRSDLFSLQGNFLGSFAELDDAPIKPRPQMSTQLAVEEPPVEDPEYVPGSLRELSNAASRMMREVPDNQIEFVYRFLHKLLDMALDKEDEEQGTFLYEAKLVTEASFSNIQKSMIANAAKEASQGVPIDVLVSRLSSSGEFDADEDDMSVSEEDIEDAVTSEMMTSLGAPPEAAPDAETTSQLPPEPDEDMTVDDFPGLSGVEDKEEYLKGYEFAADFDEAGKTEAELEAHDDVVSRGSPDFVIGYDAYTSGESSFRAPVGEEEKGFLKQRGIKPSAFGEYERAMSDYEGLRDDDDLPIFFIMPMVFSLVQDISEEADQESIRRLALAEEAGQSMRAAEKEIGSHVLAKYGIDFKNSLSRANLLRQGSSSKLPVDVIKRSISSILKNTLSGGFGREGMQNFIDDFRKAAEESDMSESQAVEFASEVLSQQIDTTRVEYDALPYEEMLRHILAANFAETVVFNVRDSIANKQRKPYQGTNTTNFRKNVKEEFTEDIIQDFLDKLTKKYLKGDNFKVKSGSSFHLYDPSEVRQKAEELVRQEVKDSLAAQAAGQIEEDELELEDESDFEVLPDESAELSEEEIAEKIGIKLSDASDYETLAPFFGFSSSSGLRQWYLKFAERQFKMLAMSNLESEDDLAKLHAQILDALLSNVSDRIQELNSEYQNEPNTKENQEIKYILDRSSQQIVKANEQFQDAGDIKDVMIDDKPFLKTLGGQIIRSMNGTYFQKALTKLDKSWTEFVASTIDTMTPGIDNKKLSGLAEYWTGKKEKPDYDQMTKAAKNLLKHDIGPELYAAIEKESSEWFEDVVSTEFSQIGDDFTGEYRELIMKNFNNTMKNKNNFKKAVLSAILDVATESSRRVAFERLSDMEVDDE